MAETLNGAVAFGSNANPPSGARGAVSSDREDVWLRSASSGRATRPIPAGPIRVSMIRVSYTNVRNLSERLSCFFRRSTSRRSGTVGESCRSAYPFGVPLAVGRGVDRGVVVPYPSSSRSRPATTPVRRASVRRGEAGVGSDPVDRDVPRSVPRRELSPANDIIRSYFVRTPATT